MSLRDRLDQLRKGQNGAQAAAKPEAKKERVGPVRYLREVREELVKVSWPKRPAVVRGTMQVLAVSILFVIILGGLDLALQLGLKEILPGAVPAAPGAVEQVPTEDSVGTDVTAEPTTVPAGETAPTQEEPTQ